jgi:hypothetical protein
MKRLLFLLFPIAAMAQYGPPQLSFPSGPSVPASCNGSMVFMLITGGTSTPYYCQVSSNTFATFGSSGGSGTVTSFSAGNLSPLFTTSVATATTTPALTFALSNAAQNSVFAGPASGGAGVPSFQTAPTISAANMTSFPTFFSALSGDATSTSTGGATTVVGINGVLLSGIATGLYKFTAGVPSAAVAGTDYLTPGGALGTPSSGVITNLTGTCTACTANNSNQLGGLSAVGAGAAIPTGPATETTTYLVCYSGSSGKQADCGSLGSAQMIASTGVALSVTSQLNSSSGNASVSIGSGNSGASAYTQYAVAGTNEWRTGAIVNTNYVIKDQVALNTVLNFPVNTMPANSISGNAQGATLNGYNPVLTLPVGTPTYTAGTNVTSVACASSYTCTNTRGELTIVGGTATTGTIATVNFSATLGAAPGNCMVAQEGGATLFGIGHGLPSTSSFTITAGISVAASTLTVDYLCSP